MDNTNLAYQFDDSEYELLNGKIVAMSPRPSINHNIIITNITTIFHHYLENKSCFAFGDGTDVYLTEDDRVIPDVMIVCNKDIIKHDAIHGTPDLIVEVLSLSTAVRDKGYKKNLYEKCGVKEYWIVDPNSKSIEVYLLKDGTYDLDMIYSIYPEYELKKMSDKEKSIIVTEFRTSLFDDLVISVNRVFHKTF